MHKHERTCRAICAAAGLTVIGLDPTRRHLHIHCVEGDVVFPKTPGDYRWDKNALRSARRVANRGR